MQGAARKAHGEDTPRSIHVLDAERTRIGFNALPRNGQTQAQACLVVTALREGAEHLFGFAAGQTPAVVFHVDEDPLSERIRLQRDLGAGAGELQGILEDIRQRCQQVAAISCNSQQRGYNRHGQRTASAE